MLLFVLSSAASFATNLPMFVTGPGIMALSIGVSFALPKGSLAMAITPEIWQADIIGNLFKDNEFLNYCYNADQYVVGGKLVHIPNAGAPSAVKRNRTSLPATVTLRSDVDVVYALDEFTTDPRLITNAESVELSYDKRMSVIGEDINALKEIIADWILYKWCPTGATRILRTTGGSVAAHLPSATGNRKLFTCNDVKAAQKKLNKDGVSKTDRYMLISSDMYDQLTTDATFTSSRDAIRDMSLPEGTIGRLYGFYLMERSTVVTATGATPPVAKDPDASYASTDNDVVLFWQKDALERAMGNTESFEKMNDPTMFGDVYSFLQRMGGRVRRDSEKGVGMIIQVTA